MNEIRSRRCKVTKKLKGPGDLSPSVAFSLRNSINVSTTITGCVSFSLNCNAKHSYQNVVFNEILEGRENHIGNNVFYQKHWGTDEDDDDDVDVSSEWCSTNIAVDTRVWLIARSPRTQLVTYYTLTHRPPISSHSFTWIQAYSIRYYKKWSSKI